MPQRNGPPVSVTAESSVRNVIGNPVEKIAGFVRANIPGIRSIRAENVPGAASNGSIRSVRTVRDGLHTRRGTSTIVPASLPDPNPRALLGRILTLPPL